MQSRPTIRPTHRPRVTLIGEPVKPNGGEMIPKHNLEEVAFPKLDASQMDVLGRCPLTKLKRHYDGEKLFEVGQCDCKFFVVKSGKIEIVDESGETPRIVRVHGPGEFTGDVGQLIGSPSLVSAVARGDSEDYEVSPD